MTLFLSLLILACGPKGDTGCEDCSELPGPCADGGWGAIHEPEAAIHVRADGNDDGDGSLDSPLLTVEAAVSTQTGMIAVGPGIFDATVVLADGVVIEGCGPDETALTTRGTSLATVKFEGVTGGRLAGVEVRGGYDGVDVQGVEVELEGLRVVGTQHAGITVDGAVTIRDVEVLDVGIDTEGAGVGIWVGNNNDWGTSYTVESVRIEGAHGLGLGLVGHGTVRDVEVVGTLPAQDGTLGRGVHAAWFSGEISDVRIYDSHDAGLRALFCSGLTLDGVVVDGVEAGVGRLGDPTGDGIVLSQIDYRVPPEELTHILRDVTVRDVPRAGVLMERVAVDLRGNSVTGGLVVDGTSILAQQEDTAESITGTDPWTLLSEPLDLSY